MTKNAVSNIVQMGNLGLVHDDAVLYFAARASLRALSERCSWSEVCVRAHYRTLANVDRTLNVGARLYTRSFRQADTALQMHARLRLSIANLFIRVKR